MQKLIETFCKIEISCVYPNQFDKLLVSLIGIMELSEYWIGDWVRIKSRDIRGSFEGIHPSQQAYVKVHDKLLIVPVEDLESTEEPSPDILLTLLEEDLPVQFAPIKQAIVFDHVIDLHYEKLAPERVNNPHTHIIEFQLESVKSF